MFLKKEDIFNFNVDEIEIYGTFSNYEELLKGINESNSDYITFDDFTIKKSDKLRDYEYKVDFWKNNLPCYAFYIGKKLNTFITTRNYFKVYGSAFQIMELNEIIDFIDTYILKDNVDIKQDNRHNTFKRLDLAIDIKKDIVKDIVPNFKELNQKGSKYFGNNGELETYYIGEYQKRLNKSFLIRIYDKIKDIKQKGKQSIYPSYLLEENITRIEIEFRTEVLKFIELNQLLDRSYIYNLFILYLQKHTKIFDKIKTDDVKKLKRLNKKISIEDLTFNQILKDRYINSFLGYSKTIIELGACPVDILIRNMIISEKTKNNIIFGMKGNIFNETIYLNEIIKKENPNIFKNFENEEFGKY